MDEENLTIYSIVNTLTELIEVNAIKILIDGQENCAFSDNQVQFNQCFVRNLSLT